MQPPLACPGIGSSPPPWTAALLPLDWRLVVFPLLAIPICAGLNAIPLRGMPSEARRRMAPWLIANGALLFFATFSATFFYVVLNGRWSDMLSYWFNQIDFQPGLLTCQHYTLDSVYEHALNDSGLVTLFGVLGPIFLANLPMDRVKAIRRTVLATYRSPDIPPVPDDVAARRAIVHRPYRRGLRPRMR